MRFLLSLVLVALAIGLALCSGAGAMLARNVLDTAGITRAVVATVRSPAGLSLVRTSVANGVADRAAAQPDVVAAGAASIAGSWAVRAVRSDAAPQILAPVAVGLQQGILTGTQRGSVQLDLRAVANATNAPPVIALVLDAVDGSLLVTIPWVAISPGAQTVLQELDRHRWLPSACAAAALGLGLLALLISRRRGLTLIVLGVGLAVSAYLLRPLATDLTGSVVARRAQDVSTGPLAAEFVNQLFDGWSSVSGALIAIGLALVLVGLVFSLRRSSR
ncbi:MAG: hypothetical protein ACR2J9_03715 [Gaiellales bacterium]